MSRSTLPFPARRLPSKSTTPAPSSHSFPPATSTLKLLIRFRTPCPFVFTTIALVGPRLFRGFSNQIHRITQNRGESRGLPASRRGKIDSQQHPIRSLRSSTRQEPPAGRAA